MHGEHAVDVVAAAYRPEGQTEQLDAPTSGETLPAAQATHTEDVQIEE